jgi:2-hydroxychromene-2-carboxylate isomerase
MSDIRLYHHPRSPYSRIGVHKIVEAGIDCRAIPFTGPPDGNSFADPTETPAKLAYNRMDVARMSERAGLSITPPDPFDVDFDAAVRAAIAAEAAGVGLAFAHALGEARWGAGRDVSDPEVLKSCTDRIGWDGYDPEDGSVARAYVRHRKLIEQDQVFGVPFLVWDDRKYWGQDRIDLFIEEYGA